ncbi:MAG: glycosyltransferase [Ignavibacteria bacterium]|jgi:glycosyltransferase involved in cell wall biosynthesis|nr:glycosyltransferase [Ignavibacteria bacterium]MDH7527480.1 glycosyltransferase [Ignavibacteria bacterium]
MKKNILIFAYHDIKRDPRALRQIKWLSKDYNVEYTCKAPDNSLDKKYYLIEATNYIYSKLRMVLLLFRFFNKYTFSKPYKKLLKTISNKKYDIIIAHHINLLPLVDSLKNKNKIILDAHEYYTEIYDDSFIWRLLMKPYHKWLAKNYLHKCDLVIAVNESMALRYNSEFNVKTNYITNAVDYEEQIPQPVDPREIKMIHHGLASRSRRIEMMIEVMQYLDARFTLTLVLLEINKLSEIYVNKLKKLASRDKRIKFLKPVEMKDVVKFGNKYDIGLFFMPPTNYNEEYSLANKVFQYIQSRLMLAFSPLPEMKKIVIENNLGIVSDNFEPKNLAQKLNSLTAEEIYRFKMNSHKKARELSSEANKIKFLKIIEEISY